MYSDLDRQVGDSFEVILKPFCLCVCVCMILLERAVCICIFGLMKVFSSRKHKSGVMFIIICVKEDKPYGIALFGGSRQGLI